MMCYDSQKIWKKISSKPDLKQNHCIEGGQWAGVPCGLELTVKVVSSAQFLIKFISAKFGLKSMI